MLKINAVILCSYTKYSYLCYEQTHRIIMGEKQKFKRGNLVEVLVGHQIWSNKTGVVDLSPDDVGRKAIINYSYHEKYGCGNVDSYSIIWLDTGNSLAWKSTNELRLIDEGGEHLFEEARLKKEIISKRDADINYIASNIDEGNLSSESILLLFDMIGHNTSFHRNGEFMVLCSDWQELHPIFLHIKNAESLEEAKSVFTEKGLRDWDVEKVYNAFNSAVVNAL